MSAELRVEGGATDEEVLALVLALRIVGSRAEAPEPDTRAAARAAYRAAWERPARYRSPSSWGATSARPSGLGRADAFTT